MDLRLIIAAVLILSGMGTARAQVLSPGRLTDDHAEIDGDDHCGRCHSSGRKVDQNKCFVCHDDLGARVARGAGLHGRQFAGQECSKCHTEHLGRNARLIRWPGGDMKKLDHTQTGWPLRGAHAQRTCTDCHDRTNERGAKTFLGLSTDCASCHEDPHDGRFGKTCQGCHEESSWKRVDLQKFDHSRTRFALTGKHRQADCKGCHGEPAKFRGLKFGACADCHADPHEGRFAKATCESCHSTEGWNLVDNIRAKHPGLSLRAGHAKVKCAECHDRGNTRAPSMGNQCVACHKPVHDAPFGRDCDACHQSIRWLGLPREIGLAAHGKTDFALRGDHRRVDCASCHPKSQPARKRFRELTFDTCGACHRDPHPAKLAARFGDCATCHTESGFAPTTFGTAGHAKTAFPLDGRHQATPCSSCHPGNGPRLDLRVAKKQCADCHENPHGTQFAAEMAAGGCASCHATVGWDRPRIDHSTWPLTGAHADTSCYSCHANGESFRGIPRDCEGCHDDEHAGQFRLSEPKRNCADCHTTDAFALPGFDHAKKAGWPLEGEHRKVACASCHPSEKLRNGLVATRWRLGYESCKSCHANPHTEDRP